MSNEPEYIRRLREAQAAQQAKRATPARAANQPEFTPQEQEALRWAKEVAEGQELRSVRHLAGARFAVVLRLQSASGQRLLSLEGIPDREALRERVKPGATVGEEVLGAYEVRGGRPVTIAIEEGQVVLKMGTPRPGSQPADPMKMLRLAAKEAAKREKERPKERPGRR
ncbi:MAG TPA: hypothetical protein VF862_01210 [Gemmatimonadales bacterium]